MYRTGLDIRILVFAKAPVPGTVKTRLAPALDAEGAAELHRRLVLQTLETAHASAVGPLLLYCAPDTDHGFFQHCAARYDAALHHQCHGDLGLRMLHACIEHLRSGTGLIIVGTDSPVLSTRHFTDAARALNAGAKIVLTPAEDGGYAMIALARCAPELFADMPWGSDQVLARTRTVLRQLGWRWRELDSVWDVDRPADYARLCAEGWLDALPR